MTLQGHRRRSRGPWGPWGAMGGPGLEAAAFAGALALETKEQAMSKEIRLKLGLGGLGQLGRRRYDL